MLDTLKRILNQGFVGSMVRLPVNPVGAAGALPSSTISGGSDNTVRVWFMFRLTLSGIMA